MTQGTVLSLFSGAGGLDIGLEASGFEILLCVEVDFDCRSTLKRNHPHWPLPDQGDIHVLTPKGAIRQTGLARGELTLLAGGPPCQPFSKSGYWAMGDTRRLTDPRAKTIDAFLDYVEEMLPQVILLENVRGFTFNGKDEGFQLLQKRLLQINLDHRVDYQASLVSLNCADFGVPQARERVFVIADRNGGHFVSPTPTHWPIAERPSEEAERYRTAWDSIGDLDGIDWTDELDLTGKWADLLPSIPEGHNYLWHTSRFDGEPLFGWRTRYWSFLLKLAKNRPSWTIQANPGPATGPFHWRNRRLSIRELCRLQTFPDDFVLEGDFRDHHRQIGNAVPPAIGEMLGYEIRHQLMNEDPTRRASFIPIALEDCPEPEAVGQVPRKYWYLRGNHCDHPGTGLGPRATRMNHNNEQEGSDGDV